MEVVNLFFRKYYVPSASINVVKIIYDMFLWVSTRCKTRFNTIFPHTHNHPYPSSKKKKIGREGFFLFLLWSFLSPLDVQQDYYSSSSITNHQHQLDESSLHCSGEIYERRERVTSEVRLFNTGSLTSAVVWRPSYPPDPVVCKDSWPVSCVATWKVWRELGGTGRSGRWHSFSPPRFPEHNLFHLVVSFEPNSKPKP